MKTIKINPTRPKSASINGAAEILKNSGIIAHATETVYGLAVIWNDWQAIQRLSKLKQRGLDQPYSLLVSEIVEIIDLIGWESDLLHQLLENIFPGPITILLPRKRLFKLTFWNQFAELGFRLPRHIISTGLEKSAGKPLVTTSANIKHAPPPRSASEISDTITQHIDCLLDSGLCQFQMPSTIIKVEFADQTYRIIRKGAFEPSVLSGILDKLNLKKL